jgi:tripartite-type tricarboxylate transporter receptor subunit TctC
MKFLRMHRLAAMLMGAIACLGGPVNAQTFPVRPITMIVPFAAGGPTDTYARIVGEQMSRVLGQQVLIENVAGAGGTTGITRGSQAKPDGYTIMMGHMGTHGSAPALYPKLRYNPVSDFAPIGMAATAPIVIVARKDFPAKDLNELVAYLKANAGKINIAHAGVGSVSFTSCTVFTALLGIRPAQVAYRGTGPALTDMMAGQIDLMCDQIVNYVEQVRGGAIRAYAIASPERSPALPDVPTTTEGGLAAYQITAWSALFAPKGTPPAIVTRLSAALDQSLEDPVVRRRLEELGGVVPPKIERTPAWLGNFVRQEVERLTPILKAAGAADR